VDQQAVADTQLHQERIDRANLNAMTTASVAKCRGVDVIGSIEHAPSFRRKRSAPKLP
jgi:hypothetical protein